MQNNTNNHDIVWKTTLTQYFIMLHGTDVEVLHCVHSPAVEKETPYGSYREYWLQGKQYTPEQYSAIFPTYTQSMSEEQIQTWAEIDDSFHRRKSIKQRNPGLLAETKMLIRRLQGKS